MRSSRGVLAVIPLTFLAVMVVWPVAAIISRSLAGVGPGDAWAILSRPAVVRTIRFTFAQALASTIITLVVGLPIAHALAHYEFRGRRLIRAITVVPFVLPTVVVAAAFAALFDLVGLNVTRSVAAILMAHVFFNVAVVVRMVGGHWQSLDRTETDAAAALGAGPLRAFREITLRRLAPALGAASLIVFMFSFTSFGVILILGGPTRATLETEINRYAVFRGELDVAAVLALVQIIVVAVLAVASGLLQRRFASISSGGPSGTSVRPQSASQRSHLAAVLALVAVVVGSPLGALAYSSLRVGDGLGFKHYTSLVDEVALLPVSPAGALGRSIVIAFAAAALAFVVAMAAGRVITRRGAGARLIETAVFVPLGISAVTLGFGYIVAFTVLDFRTSVWIVPAAHAVIGLPFVLGALLPAWRSAQGSILEAAATLGASPRQIFTRVEWPLIAGAAAIGVGFSAAVSLGEFGATTFISRSSTTFTAPLAIFRLLGQPGESPRGQAMALSVVVGVLVAVLAALLERRRGEEAVLL